MGSMVEEGAIPLVLVDGFNLLWRAAYGFPARITAPDGRDVTPMFGFLALLRKALREPPGPGPLADCLAARHQTCLERQHRGLVRVVRLGGRRRDRHAGLRSGSPRPSCGWPRRSCTTREFGDRTFPPERPALKPDVTNPADVGGFLGDHRPRRARSAKSSRALVTSVATQTT